MDNTGQKATLFAKTKAESWNGVFFLIDPVRTEHHAMDLDCPVFETDKEMFSPRFKIGDLFSCDSIQVQLYISTTGDYFFPFEWL